jgi:hypothetical protein
LRFAAFAYRGDAFVDISGPFQRRAKLVGPFARRGEAGRLTLFRYLLGALGRERSVRRDRARHVIELSVNGIPRHDTFSEANAVHFLRADFPSGTEQFERSPETNNARQPDGRTDTRKSTRYCDRVESLDQVALNDAETVAADLLDPRPAWPLPACATADPAGASPTL